MDISDLLTTDLNTLSPEECALHLKMLTAYDPDSSYYNPRDPLHDNVVRAVGRLEEKANLLQTFPDGTPREAIESVVIGDGAYQNLLGGSRVAFPTPNAQVALERMKQDFDSGKIRRDGDVEAQTYSTGGQFNGSQRP